MNQTKKHTKEETNTHEQQMRARIKEAAFELMADKGIEEVSMREIAEKVRVTKPVLYYYFKDKEDLCAAIIEEHESHFAQFMQGVLDKNPDASSLLSQVFERHVNFFQRDPRNSKFIVRMIAYALSGKFKHNKENRTESLMCRMLDVIAQKDSLSPRAVSDVHQLSHAVLLQIMLSAYIQLHVPHAHHGEEQFYDKDSVSRVAQIIMLGTKAYYKTHKK